MARDLKKFVNPKFLKTVNLGLFRRLFERQPAASRGFDLAAFDGDEAEVRDRLKVFFEGTEDELPRGIVADLHHIAELGTENGMHLLQERATARDINIAAPLDPDGNPIPLDPKHFALLAFLDHRPVFDAASDMLARQARSSLAEYVGLDEGIEPRLDDDSRAAFEAAAAEMFQRDHRGAFCRVGWYEDGDQTVLVVTHGAPVAVVPVINGDQEDVISYRSVEYAVLAYNVGTGRMGVGGVRKALRAELAEFFAVHMLRRPGFFAGEDCQDLYTLDRIENVGFGFRVNHAFDAGIQQVDIVEVQIDRIGTDPRSGEVAVEAQNVTRDFRGNALTRLNEFGDRISFSTGRYRIGHIIIRIHFGDGRSRASRVTVKIKPPSLAVFKRQRFEARVMELLRRNGFCRERQPAEAAAAAE
ncbi:hypothetical protein [Falsiroseomonas selenitidurans]|uniref:Uncharacterized protein n=1 Tax=Falsiroseomonas selenitidurans TaxID=2716335 RepID=A0ABX1E4I0_9PROT|nr:hypothetical protein [Falsiroseomonas selenitidurans]NKC31605.1 hypothetical protein [Falsiroseomonas selenitidurans]